MEENYLGSHSLNSPSIVSCFLVVWASRVTSSRQSINNSIGGLKDVKHVSLNSVYIYIYIYIYIYVYIDICVDNKYQ